MPTSNLDPMRSPPSECGRLSGRPRRQLRILSSPRTAARFQADHGGLYSDIRMNDTRVAVVYFTTINNEGGHKQYNKRGTVGESALSEGTPPVGPWRGVCVSACDIVRALRSRSTVVLESVNGSVRPLKRPTVD
eukprot:scaffold5537_cov112-Isochrysis_galbana.AAC.1